ncbi:ATPase [Saccharobesus litoralis]|uniref:ATPase n=1 Tax=Saccharobesus litoralis TaxID=2172099 RepID=A0A2S0VPX6_9ALTE|nr:ATP-binding protein [Saccharobesus litoralis]AWB66275.1 ATPase [Saccharobesus litoralis]
MKKFYNRQSELTQLTSVSANIESTNGQLSVLVGKRRVGKTRLLKEALFRDNQQRTLYLFISRKSESMLVKEFADLIVTELGAKFFKPDTLRDVFEYLLDYSTQRPLTVIIDEFQDIQRVNDSLFSDLQNLWGSYKAESMMHLVCCGSMYNMMTKIFKEKDEPLMNRDDRFFHIKPLKPSIIKAIMQDVGVFSAERMLEWWCLSGGIPKYLEWLSYSTQNDSVFDYVISSSSPFMKEGLHRLVEDFGAEHAHYFDILNAIARGKTSRSDIKNYVDAGIDVHLERLEKNFNVVSKYKPISSKETTRDTRFSIEDPFLNFWFTFIHSNASAVEMDNFDYIKAHIKRDFSTFSGLQLEGLFKAILAESNQFNQIGSYWNNKGRDEIDIVAINKLDKIVLIAEVKRNQSKYDEAKLIGKAQGLLAKMNLSEHKVSYRGFSLDNLEQVMEEFKPRFDGN